MTNITAWRRCQIDSDESAKVGRDRKERNRRLFAFLIVGRRNWCGVVKAFRGGQGGCRRSDEPIGNGGTFASSPEASHFGPRFPGNSSL
jgi:hypothetical protein